MFLKSANINDFFSVSVFDIFILEYIFKLVMCCEGCIICFKSDTPFQSRQTQKYYFDVA